MQQKERSTAATADDLAACRHRAPQLGQKPRFLQEKATSLSAWQRSHNHPQEAVVEYAAAQVFLEFLAHLGWQRAVFGLKTREEVWVVRLCQRVQQRALGSMARVARRRRRARLRGPPVR